MDKDIYLNKVTNFLTPTDFPTVSTNPTSSFLTYVKKILSLTNDTLNFFNSDKNKLYPMNAQTPLLYGLPKIHKIDIPIRPVVSYTNSPAHKLASRLNDVIISSTNFTSKYATRNCLELTNRLKDIKLPNISLLVSFDIKNLFFLLSLLMSALNF